MRKRLGRSEAVSRPKGLGGSCTVHERALSGFTRFQDTKGWEFPVDVGSVWDGLRGNLGGVDDSVIP